MMVSAILGHFEITGLLETNIPQDQRKCSLSRTYLVKYMVLCGQTMFKYNFKKFVFHDGHQKYTRSNIELRAQHKLILQV